MTTRYIRPEFLITMRLVKSEDLNHHGTLFAGRTAEWFVESGFIAATSVLPPKNVVCLKIHGMFFTKPAKSGDVLKFCSRIAYTGKSSLTVYVKVDKNGDGIPLVDGFVTFIHVDDYTRSAPHNLELIIETEEEILLRDKAAALKGY